MHNYTDHGCNEFRQEDVGYSQSQTDRRTDRRTDWDITDRWI